RPAGVEFVVATTMQYLKGDRTLAAGWLAERRRGGSRERIHGASARAAGCCTPRWAVRSAPVVPSGGTGYSYLIGTNPCPSPLARPSKVRADAGVHPYGSSIMRRWRTPLTASLVVVLA